MYAKSKVDIEKHLFSLKGNVDYCLTILRFATAFGLSPRMRFDLTVNQFTRELYEGEEVLVYDPDTWRPYCHVKDFSAIIQKVLEANNSVVDFEVFNAGSEKNNFTKRMVVDEVKQQVPHAKVAYQEKGSDPRDYRVSFRKLHEKTPFRANLQCC